MLTKPPKEIKLLSIINAVDEKIKTLKCRKESKRGCNHKSIKCITHNLWDDLEIHINNFFENNTLNEISVRLVGSLTLFLAKSAIAITAYLPFDVSFMLFNIFFPWFYWIYLHNPTKLVKIIKKTKKTIKRVI